MVTYQEQDIVLSRCAYYVDWDESRNMLARAEPDRIASSDGELNRWNRKKACMDFEVVHRSDLEIEDERFVGVYLLALPAGGVSADFQLEKTALGDAMTRIVSQRKVLMS